MATPGEEHQPADEETGHVYLADSWDFVKNKLDTCPNAMSLQAFSPALNATVIRALPCNQWSCRWCIRIKKGRIIRKVTDAKPNRLLTLTINPSLYESPREAFDATRRQLPRLFHSLRATYDSIEYFRVVEVTRRGWPHYHCCVRSNYLPHHDVKATWERLTGATIVDLRQIKKTSQAVTYIVKYLSKLSNIPWTARHMSYSKKFFPKEPDKPKADHDYVKIHVVKAHPVTCITVDKHVTHFENLPNGWFKLTDTYDRGF